MQHQRRPVRIIVPPRDAKKRSRCNLWNCFKAFALVLLLIYFYFVSALLRSRNTVNLAGIQTATSVPSQKGQQDILSAGLEGKFLSKKSPLDHGSNDSVDINVDGTPPKNVDKEKDSDTTRTKEQIVEDTDMPKRPSCFVHGTPCRFDEVGKYLEGAAKFTIIHKQSDAIPNHRRIPPSMVDNATYISSRRSLGAADGSMTALFEYNPTLLPLTSELDETLLDYLTGRYHPDITDEEANKVKYLSISRAANLHGCARSMRKFGQPTKEQSYLNLALLDADLQPIPDASAALLPFYVLFPQCYEEGTLSDFQDYQIIAVRSTKGNRKKDQLFLTTSDRKTSIFPIDIRRVLGPTNDAEGWNTKMKSKPVPMIPEEGDSPDLFYGKGLQVRFMDDIAPKNSSRGTGCKWGANYHSMDWKKNYHVFDVPDVHGSGENPVTYIELRPHWARMTRKINFYAEKFEKYEDWELVPNGTFENFWNDGHRSETDVQLNQYKGGEPQEQFSAPKNTDWEASSGFGRGTACCVDFDFGNNQTFKVGISHTTTEGRGYLSRFYAFDLRAPKFLVVALSGPFCFGGLNNDTDINSEIRYFPHQTRKLNATYAFYNCPPITFASGITEYHADTNYVVISYGVNDCYSRSMVVSKERIIEFLDVNRTESWRPWNW